MQQQIWDAYAITTSTTKIEHEKIWFLDKHKQQQ